MNEPIRVEKSRQQMNRHALEWMVSIYGAPKDIEDPEQKDKFYQRLGLLCSFITDFFPE
jgi:hypothetical protein